MSGFGDLGDLSEGGEVQPESLAGDFLKNVAEADRPVLEKYLKDWDAGVTKRFQSIHDQYKPFKDVDPDEMQAAFNLMQLIENDPEFIYNQIAEYLQQNGRLPNMQQEPEQEEFVDDDPYGAKIGQMEKVLTALAERFLDAEDRTTKQQEDAQLDSIMADLQAKHGDFDEEFVLAKMLQGYEPEDAVAAWGKTLESALETHRTRRPAPVMGSGGGVPGGGIDPSKLNSSQTQELIAQMLQHASGQG